ncbi:MAG: pyridoxal phosphate-dependent aminotransferase [Deltaproteobacteria bacterium]|nr:pyridoxal phosphate-dependent aminotransferase [Deltaproteobacteria bacterium]
MPAAPEIREAVRQGSWIRRMFEEGARLKAERGDENVCDFTLGNPYGDPPAFLTSEIARLSANPPPDLHKYMPNAGFADVRSQVARSLARLTGLPFTPDHVVMTVGAAGALNVALRAILSPGDEVVVIAPYFVEYLFYIRNAGGVPVVAQSSDDFRLDVGAIRGVLSDRTKALLLNSPNNPTGSVYGGEELRALAAALADHERRTGTPVTVLSDEPYRKIVYPGTTFEPPAAYLPNTLVAYSHSKDLNIPGERIGYLAVSPRAADAGELSEACVFCNRVLGFVNAPSLMQRAVAPCQELPAEMSVYRRNREALLAVLRESGIEAVPPGGAFYLFPRSPIADDMAFTAAARDEGLLLVPGSGFGRAGHFRIAYCVPPETVARSLPAWRRLGEKYAGARETRR